VVYKISTLGRASYNDGRCWTTERYANEISGPALVYGTLEFDRVIKLSPIGDSSRDFTSLYKKRFTFMQPWGSDKELRRAWKMPGVTEIENQTWYIHVRLTSNGQETIGVRMAYEAAN